MVRFRILGDKIRLAGIGGAGIRAVNRMIEAGLQRVEFLTIDTDALTLELSRASRRIQIGQNILRGAGSNGDPETGRRAIEEDQDRIAQALDGSDMVFLVAGLGGGTSTGAGPVVAHMARKSGAFTIWIVSKPFAAEGVLRMRTARAGIVEFREATNALILIPNQRLLVSHTQGISLRQAFLMADDILLQAVQGITDLTSRDAKLDLSFGDIKSALSGGGYTLMGLGEASGEQRAEEAARKAIRSGLLGGASVCGAKRLLVSVSSGYDSTLLEMHEAICVITEAAGCEADITWGTMPDDIHGEMLRVTLYRPGCERKDVV